MQFEDPTTAMAKVSTYIALNTKGDNYPKEIWLSKNDYQQLYKELQEIQRYYRGHGVLRVPEDKFKAGFRAVYYDGAEVIYSPFAEPLPDQLENMKDWVNRPWNLKPEEEK